MSLRLRSLPRFQERGIIVVILVLGLLLTVFGGKVRLPLFERGPDGGRHRVFEAGPGGGRVPAFVVENKFLNAHNLAQLAKTNGFRKTSDTWTIRQNAYTLVIESQGTNPNQCHMDVTHPVDQDAPGREIVVALHNWAELTNGWSLYRNDKSVQSGFEYTTRSWQKDADGKSEALAFTTQRHPDGTPMQRSSDSSQLIYSQTKDPS